MLRRKRRATFQLRIVSLYFQPQTPRSMDIPTHSSVLKELTAGQLRYITIRMVDRNLSDHFLIQRSLERDPTTQQKITSSGTP